MSGTCLICLNSTDSERYHASCLVELFAAPALPHIALDLASIPARAQREAEKISISGVQPKVTVDFQEDCSALVLMEPGGRFILKSQQAHPNAPENEHLTMRLARSAGLIVPPCGLFTLSDGTWAYLVRRFDRVWETQQGEPEKRHQLDFCQLADIDPKDRYRSSAERCVELVRSSVAQAEMDLLRLFQLFLFSYFAGNGDLHLKNISVVEQADGSFALSPSYDLMCTGLYADQTLAIPLNGRTRDLKRGDWLTFGLLCGISADKSSLLIDEMSERILQSEELIGQSLLSRDMQKKFVNIIHKRVRALAISGRSLG